MSSVDVRDIFGNKSRKDDVISAGAVGQHDGRDTHKLLWPHHKEDKLDRIVKEYGQGTGYSEWQRKTYPVKVSYKNEILRKKAEERRKYCELSMIGGYYD